MLNQQTFIIKTNAKQFGQNFGVYLQDSIEYGYYREAKNTNDLTFTDYNGQVWERDTNHSKPRFMRSAGTFVKQETFSHGEFIATEKFAKELTKKLSDNARNSWVKLYYVK
tara:strand:+ start:96 stop:428 length:333 start_codon:yes stop_codon:yes gene_type:complete